jgi:aspartyl-tRNA(Asn)/glutamyl-tRNA(Gln) amidotransferase subunit A
MIAYASSLDQAGVLARTAKDCALVLSAMSGFDNKDSTSIERPIEDYILELERYSTVKQGLKNIRIGVPMEYFTDGVAPDVRSAVEDAITQLEQLGAIRVKISLPRTSLSIPAYYVIAPAEASSNLSRFDGVRYGFRAANTDFTDLDSMYSQSRAQGFGEEVKRRILTGAYVLSSESYQEYYVKAQRIRHLIAQDFKAAFEQCDVIAGPVAPTVAWNLGKGQQDPMSEYLADIFNLGVNLAGLPSMSVPCGMGGIHKNRPIGLQLISNYFDESRLLSIAHAYQCATDWHQKTPAII